MSGSISAERKILEDLFPEVIKHQGETKLPLKVGIIDDIVEAVPEIETSVVKKALQDYTGGPTYHRVCIEDGAVRVDLMGKPVEPVNEEQKLYHRRRLKRLEDRWEGRQKARRSARNKKPINANLGHKEMKESECDGS